jgi:protein-S-isoprenylcysteine O-methyltransferase Ste14
MKMSGPFRASRHPLTFGMLPVFWLMPRMTVNLAAFNLVATVYIFAGALHEEKRLRAAYEQAYLDYQKSGAGFFVSAISDFLKRLNSAQHMKTNK